MGKAISRLLGIEEIKETDIIIAVVGKSGSGKSTFINTAAGEDILHVNHGLTPVASDVRHVGCSKPDNRDRRVVFVDTPAFDSERDEREVEQKLRRWLRKFASKKAKIFGILYLHQITDSKLTDPPGPRLSLLKSLSENSGGAFPNRVVLVTTMWGLIQSAPLAEQRAQELQLYCQEPTNFPPGSVVLRFNDSFESAWQIVFVLLGIN